MRRAWWTVVAMVGCAPEAKLTDPLTFETVEHEAPEYGDSEQGMRGPGQWHPSAAGSLEVSLITSGLMRGDRTVVANARGDHATFGLDGNACEVDAETGNMDTDTKVQGENLEVVDAEPSGEFLVLTSDGLFRVVPDTTQVATLGGAGKVESVRFGDFLAARLVGDQVFAVTSACGIYHHGQPDAGLSLAPSSCDQGAPAVASTPYHLVVAGAEGTVLVNAISTEVLDAQPSERVATVGQSIFVSSGRQVRALSENWTHELAADALITDLVAADDLGIVIVGFSVEQDSQAHVLDSETGQLLGTFDTDDQTEGLSVSSEGGLLLQIRHHDAVSWRITR